MPSQGLKASAGYNHAISDFLMTLNGMCLSAPTWLLQCLRYQHGSCFVHPCCSPVLLSCCATRLHGPNPCATQCMTRRDTFLLLYSSKKTKQKKAFIKMLLVLAQTCLPPLFQCRGVGALWWSMDISFSACRGGGRGGIILKLKVEGLYSVCFYVHVLTESAQLCTCISALYQIIWLCLFRRKGIRPQKVSDLLQVNEKMCWLINYCTIYHFSATTSYRLVIYKPELAHKRTSTKMKCMYIACLCSCLCLRHRRSGIHCVLYFI